ncbi:MAG: type II secretion system F family protein [Patescibacteria group bacterium]
MPDVPGKTLPEVTQQKNLPKRRSWFSNIGIGKEKDYFLENLAVLLTSGMDIMTAIKAIRGEIKSKRMLKIIDTLVEDIESGSYLWRALENTNLLPSHIVFLIKLGEETGRLSENLAVVSIQQQKDRELLSKVRSAMIYPVIVFSLTITIGLGIAWFVLPRLSKVFAELKISLPFLTKGIIAIGAFLGNYGSFVVPIAIAVVLAIFYFLFIFKRTKFIGQSILLVIPGIKRLIQDIELSRFGYILGTLLGSGLLITRSLDSIYEATNLRRYQRFYRHLRDSLEDGGSFRESFDSYPETRKLLSLPVQQMIIAGEGSGRLSESLIKIGEIYEKRADTTTKNLAVILEPILLVLVWLGVVAVALSVILPIYSLIGGLNQN